MKHAQHPFHVHARRMHNGVCDYYDRAAQFATEAKTKTPTADQDGITHWTPRLLREVSHLHELENECYDAASVCMTQYQRATLRAYQRSQLVAVCNTKTRTPVARFTLAEVAQLHTPKGQLAPDKSPPGSTATVSPIATCAASNAPGLVRHAHKTQRGVAT